MVLGQCSAAALRKVSVYRVNGVLHVGVGYLFFTTLRPIVSACSMCAIWSG